MLIQPELGREYVVYSDASYSGLRCVLMQDENVVMYASKQLKLLERNKPTHGLELAVVVVVLKIWRHNLYGEKCHSFMDHESFEIFADSKRIKFETEKMD